ncbi:MAG: NADAR family protein [Chromatiales bacterium]|nr:NADAR family protein [Gammaproteobacteria bacterium]MCP5352438.1 NADAR family protein [Chromatiales bacterium]
MFFKPRDLKPAVRVSRVDETDPLSASSPHAFHLDDADWPTTEHYYQGMKFLDPGLREQVRVAAGPEEARKLGKQHRRQVRDDWKKVRVTVMTRGVYIKCRTHAEVTGKLLATGGDDIVESSSYDYFWGIGRDGRGDNEYGKLLMAVRARLNAEAAEA